MQIGKTKVDSDVDVSEGDEAPSSQVARSLYVSEAAAHITRRTVQAGT